MRWCRQILTGFLVVMSMHYAIAQADTLQSSKHKLFCKINIIKQNRDTLYTGTLDVFLYTKRVYRFMAWYPGTRVVRHKFTITQRPACYDCYSKRKMKEWEYDSTGTIKYYYIEKRRGGRIGPSTCRSITKHYQRGKLMSIDRKDCDK